MQLPFGSGLVKGAITIAFIAVFVYVLLGLVSFLYEGTMGGGIRNAEDIDDEEKATSDDGLRRGNDDEEWKYY